jgi:16S rRNA (guanine966-N2)-methyltransferase
MRIIAGKYRSRLLRSLPGPDVRPTADRLRETLFNILTAGNPSALEGTTWLDLYAGTGAVGIEALSRGAAKVYFVESSLRAADLIRQNLKSLGAESQVLTQDVTRALRALARQAVVADIIYLDPPYRLENEYQTTLEFLSKSGLIKAGTIVIAEHQKKFDPGGNFHQLERNRKLEQGDAALSFYTLIGAKS